MKIYYKFDPSQNSAFLREYLDVKTAPAQRKFTKECILQAWVFGDGTGNLFRFAVDDPSGAGSHEVSPWYPLDFVGWKLLKWDLRDGVTGEWLTVSDGTLDGTLNFDSFQIEYVNSLGNNEGTLYIEDLMVLTHSVNAIRPVGLSEEFTFVQNYPNPFNPTTTISFTIPAASNVRLDIYNVRGEKVCTLVNGYYSAGHYVQVWDGKNVDGLAVPSGVYMLRMISEGGLQIRNMLLLK